MRKVIRGDSEYKVFIISRPHGEAESDRTRGKHLIFLNKFLKELRAIQVSWKVLHDELWCPEFGAAAGDGGNETRVLMD